MEAGHHGDGLESAAAGRPSGHGGSHLAHSHQFQYLVDLPRDARHKQLGARKAASTGVGVGHLLNLQYTGARVV